MSYNNDHSIEVTAELDILSINVRRDLAAVMPLNPSCADIVRLAIINDISSKIAFDTGDLSALLGKSTSFVERRISYLEKRGWLRYNKFTGAIKMGELFSKRDDPFIKDLNFLINQTRNSLEELRALAGLEQGVAA